MLFFNVNLFPLTSKSLILRGWRIYLCFLRISFPYLFNCSVVMGPVPDFFLNFSLFPFNLGNIRMFLWNFKPVFSCPVKEQLLIMTNMLVIVYTSRFWCSRNLQPRLLPSFFSQCVWRKIRKHFQSCQIVPYF